MNALLPSDKFRIPPGPQSRYRKLPVIGPVLDEVLTWLKCQGYAESNLRSRFSGISRLIRWLQRRRRPNLSKLTQLDLHSAYDHFRARHPGVASTTHVVARFFREHQLIPEGKQASSPASERELEAYGSYLREVRGLAPSTIEGHQNRLRFFLKFLKFDQSPSVIRTLRLDQIEAFLRRTARTNNRFSLQHVVASLRSFLQRQHAQGVLKKPFHQQIDSPRTYRLEQLPRALPWEQVVALLRSIDRTQPDGLRDLTLLYLAARYGLRSGELVRLTLDDIDWRAGILRIQQTKTGQTLQLPLTDEAGDLLVRYLKTARPPSSLPELFLRRKAPVGPLAHTAVHDILELRIRRSGLGLPRIGSHALRHSLAVFLLRRGVALGAIGAVLGHRDPESTSVYLRLAVDDLRAVGLSVPRCHQTITLDPKGWNTKLPRVRLQLAPPLRQADFQSGLATSLSQYLGTRRALGRGYVYEEAVLRCWDDFLHRRFGQSRRIRSRMFHDWAQTMPQVTPTVRRNRLRIVRNFLLFHARSHPQTYIPELTTLPKTSPHRPPRLVSVSEVARVLAAACQLPVSHQNPLRPQTIRLALLLLFCCGLRRGELLRLQWRHYSVQEKVLRIEATKFHKSRLVPVSPSVAQELEKYWTLRGKGNKERVCPLWPETARALRQHLETQGIGLQEARHVFRNQHGYPLTRFGVRWIMQKHVRHAAKKVASLKSKRLHPHSLRHGTASYLLRAGVDLSTIAHWLGHANVNTTYKYLALDLEDKRKALAKVKPILGRNGKSGSWRSDQTLIEWLESLGTPKRHVNNVE